MLGICILRMLVMHETLLIPVNTYESETMLWKEKEKSRIRPVQMDNFRGLFVIRRMDRVLSLRIRELCRVTKSINKRIHEGVLRWFCHVESMEKDRIGKRIYVRKFSV